MSVIGGLVILASTFAFWGGVGWLVVQLIRHRSIRRALGFILLGMLLLPLGIIISIVGGSDEPATLGPTDAPGELQDTTGNLGTVPTNPVPFGTPVVHSGIEITVLEVRRNYPESMLFFEPKEGHEWITVTLRLRNVGSSRDETDHYNSSEFRITGSRGVIYDTLLTPDTDTPLGSGEFFGGGEVTGDVVQEVAIGDSDLVLIYSPPFEGSRYLSLES